MTVDYIAVASLEDIPDGGNKAFKVDGHDILLCRAAGDVYAVSNICTHQLAALEGGAMRGCYLFCPLHGTRYDVRDGSTKGKLAKRPLETYPVRLKEGKIEVALDNNKTERA